MNFEDVEERDGEHICCIFMRFDALNPHLQASVCRGTFGHHLE